MPPPKFPKPKPKPHPHPRPGPRRGFWRRGYGPEVVYVEAVSPWLDEWWYFDAWTADLRRLAAEGPVMLHSNFDALRRSQALRQRFGVSAKHNRVFRWDAWSASWKREPSWEA